MLHIHRAAGQNLTAHQIRVSAKAGQDGDCYLVIWIFCTTFGKFTCSACICHNSDVPYSSKNYALMTYS